MPQYLYQNQDTGEVIEIIQSMNEEHRYFDKNGLEWKRIWTLPQANIDTKLDPNDPKSFVRYTGARRGTLGDMQDLSAALSAERAAKNNGIDPQKEKYFDSQFKKSGIEHAERRRRKANEKLNKLGISIE